MDVGLVRVPRRPGGRRRRSPRWDTKTYKILGSPFTGHTGAVTSVAFSLDSKVLASGSEDHSVRLWTV
ncbi:hypothetical protein [Streptosporangium sp. NPDC006007]|uniref:WD40 repeat domain-containing protein n=1 Tax=Streptosporangium sp. NPDC006007 TaxID=3154575 RepID=UPI0033A1C649